MARPKMANPRKFFSTVLAQSKKELRRVGPNCNWLAGTEFEATTFESQGNESVLTDVAQDYPNQLKIKEIKDILKRCNEQ